MAPTKDPDKRPRQKAPIESPDRKPRQKTPTEALDKLAVIGKPGLGCYSANARVCFHQQLPIKAKLCSVLCSEENRSFVIGLHSGRICTIMKDFLQELKARKGRDRNA